MLQGRAIPKRSTSKNMPVSVRDYCPTKTGWGVPWISMDFPYFPLPYWISRANLRLPTLEDSFGRDTGKGHFQAPTKINVQLMPQPHSKMSRRYATAPNYQHRVRVEGWDQTVTAQSGCRVNPQGTSGYGQYDSKIRCRKPSVELDDWMTVN
jgi:hypothetical protein